MMTLLPAPFPTSYHFYLPRAQVRELKSSKIVATPHISPARPSTQTRKSCHLVLLIQATRGGGRTLLRAAGREEAARDSLQRLPSSYPQLLLLSWAGLHMDHIVLLPTFPSPAGFQGGLAKEGDSKKWEQGRDMGLERGVGAGTPELWDLPGGCGRSSWLCIGC